MHIDKLYKPNSETEDDNISLYSDESSPTIGSWLWFLTTNP